MRLTAEALLTQPRLDSPLAERNLIEAIETARGQEAKFWELRAASALSRLWSGEGRKDEALSLLAPAYGWFSEGFDTLELRSAKALIAELQG